MRFAAYIAIVLAGAALAFDAGTLLPFVDIHVTNDQITSPLSISGCVLWLDAQDTNVLFDSTSGGNLVTNGGAVARVNDKSADGNNATQSNASYRPTRYDTGINSRRALLFDNSDGFSFNLPSSNSATVVTVMLSSQSTGYVMYYSTDNGNKFFWVSSYNDASEYIDLNTGDIVYYANGTLQTWTTRDNIFQTLHDVPTVVTATVVDFTAWSANSPTMFLGGYTSFMYGGYVGEVIFYNRVLSSTERTTLETWLKAKWGIN